MTLSFNRFKKDHWALLDHSTEIEEIRASLTQTVSPREHERLLGLLKRFIELLYTHDHRESNPFFMVDRDRVPDPDPWQEKWVKIHDKIILDEARRLYHLASGELSLETVARLRDNRIDLLRWIRKHVSVEEEHLFPGYGEAPPPFVGLDSGIQSPKRVAFWNRVKSIFKWE